MGYRLRSVILKLLLVATAVTTAFFSYSSVRGVEAGISLLVVLASLKILEAHTAREFRVMVLIGWMLCLCGFFLSQDFTTALCLLIAFALLAVALIQFHRGAAPGALWPPLVTTCKLLLQASPLVVLFFLLFPRINAGLRFELRPFRSANTGFSDRLSPGSIAALANSSEIAFRAEFPGSSTRPSGPMYWRGVVMWRCNGMEWRAPYEPRPKTPSTTPDIAASRSLTVRSPNAKEIQQRITLSATWGALDVCARPPDQNCSRCNARTRRLSLELSADSKIPPIRGRVIRIHRERHHSEGTSGSTRGAAID